MIFSKKLVIVGLLSASVPVHADPIKGRSEVLSHPFKLKNTGFNLQSSSVRDADNESLMNIAPDDIAEAGLSPRFRLRQKSFNELSLYTDRKIETVSYGFDLDDVPVCDLEIKVHRTMDGFTTLLGELPIEPEQGFTSDDWASDEEMSKIIGQTLLLSSLGNAHKVDTKEKCLWSEDGYKPVWKMTVTAANGLNYDVIANGSEVFRFDPRHFHETGTATVFKTNINEGVEEALAVPEMDASGLLANPYFKTCLPTAENKTICSPSEGTSPYGFVQETSLLYNFNRATDPNRFTQTSIFAHTNMALEWLKSKGYANFGTTQIKLLAHAKIDGDINNALYKPASGSSSPMILVGDGDGEILQNLGTDADVVSHELGHHVVYNSITQISGESLVIHEALADFFTFARTGNACLGESICPDTSKGRQVCAVPTKCLRSAENTLALGDPKLSNQAHLRGQFISGLLWDLNKKDEIPQDEVTSMVLKSVDLLVYNSGYKHLIVALLLVDHTDFGDKYCSKILARAKVRGLSDVLSDVSCESIQSSGSDKGKVTTYLSTESDTSSAVTVSKKSKKSGCGVINGSGGSGQSAGLLLILSLPVAITWIRRKKS